MMTKLIAVALFMLAAVPALASDASFDQRNLAASPQTVVSPQTAAPSQAKDSQPRACTCRHG